MTTAAIIFGILTPAVLGLYLVFQGIGFSLSTRRPQLDQIIKTTGAVALLYTGAI